MADNKNDNLIYLQKLKVVPEEAKKEIDWWRDFQFERLVDEALYERRLEKVKNL